MDWVETIRNLRQSSTSYVLVTIIEARGSSPRGAGTHMIVTPTAIEGTIGGGKLEFLVMEKARQMLSESLENPEFMKVPLGASTGQCCGGEVSLFLEPWIGTSPLVAIFGAGHVGQDLVNILSGCGLRVSWYDSRKEFVPTVVPNGVEFILSDHPEDEVEELEDGGIAIILTHSHALDLKLCERFLKLRKPAFLGLIGSQTKRKKFESQLELKGFSSTQIKGIECPVGIEGVGGKHPRHIAISIAARLLQITQNLGIGRF